MKKTILILITAGLFLTSSCSRSDSATTSDITGTWLYKSVAGTISTPTGSGPMSCTNTSGTITLNSNGSYTMSAVTSACNYTIAGMSIPIPLSISGSSGTYVRSGNSLTTTPSSGQVFMMTIQEVTTTRMILKLNQMITTGITADVTYTLEK